MNDDSYGFKAPRIETSPNCIARKLPIRYVILHHTATDSLESVINWFKDPKSDRSAHYVIAKDGQLVQVVEESLVAWHCKGKNHQSIGIEIVSKDSPLTKEQDVALDYLVRNILHRHSLDYKAIYGHRYIGDTKTECPGNLFDKYGDVFGWAKLRMKAEFPEVIT